MFIENLNRLKYVDMKPGGRGRGGGGGVLNKVLCMYASGEAPPRGPTPYPFLIPNLELWIPITAVNAPDYKTFVFFLKISLV